MQVVSKSISAFGNLLLVVVLLAIFPHPMNGQFGADLLSFVPSECSEDDMMGGGQELDDVLGCVLAPSNLFRCFGLTSVLDPDLIPDPSDITDCVDIEDPYCLIEAECDPCSEVIKALMRCIVVHSNGVDANVTELVEECPFDCSL
mmetsp:Transcript_608/g.1446  ORF Transcript_608/g.1446 Transcript_608/m.1446 type:complete len:146 (-) Transcript_608:241-678(-)|eukprot:CAMPEP_0116118622 /NCGR_PEP_ID=MMETSP0329-20121206/2205_1 /TAXON_ID=697910 /ORGANISM="Pseudo-nitzschia arenysensis, Strain B593" /LENGTH=145 /DNA_ID=CAMNT_0003612267 /DNA_START=297 /DNA_END=734 /DNA_ORIENTATION=-